MHKTMLSMGLILIGALSAMAIEIATPELGRSLFESPQLGKAGRSCATCHPGGKGLEEVGAFSDTELKDMINACIRNALKGTPFANDTQELNALMMHVRSLQPTK